MYKKGTLLRIKMNNKVCLCLSQYNDKEWIVLYDNEEWVFFEDELEVISV